MQKIITKSEEGKKRKRNQLILGIILIAILVISTAGYALSDKNNENSVNKVRYKNIDFIRDGEYWRFNLNGNDFISRYNPYEAENISIKDYMSIENYRNEPIYFEGSGDSINEIAASIGRFVLRMQNACLQENCSEGLPIKDCSSDNVISIREPKDSEKESITKNKNCVFIIASPENQTIYADAFLFKLLGIN